MVAIESTSIITETIYPCKQYSKTPYKQLKIPLHGLDVFTPPSPFIVFWYFDSPAHPIMSSEVIGNLKSTLAQALALYPPVAGVVRHDADGNSYIALDEENCPGTPFKFETRNTNFEYGHYKGVSPRNKKIDILPPGSSILEVKVTQFLCGKIAVATSIQHQVADLHGLVDFIKIWAALARGEPVNYKSIPSDWNRNPSQFFPSVQGKPIIPRSWSTSSSPIPFEKRAERFFIPFVTFEWDISKSAVDQLKADLIVAIKSSNSSNHWISKGDAVASLFAGALTRARESSNVVRPWGRSRHESQIEVIKIICNARTRCISDGKVESHEYFGNLTTASFVSTPRAKLLSPTIDASCGVALAIRNRVKEDTLPQTVANYIAYFGDQDVIKPSGGIYADWDITISNWCQQDIQSPSFDFGWGSPFIGMSGNVNSMPGGYCVIMNGRKQGDVSVLIGVEQACAKTFNSDPLLNKYATLCYSNEE